MNLRKRAAELLEQGHYTDRPSRILNHLLILLISLNVVAIILESVAYIYARYEAAFWYFEVFSVVVFTIEYVARVPIGKILGGVIGLIGIGMIALPAAIMASGFAENIHGRRERYNQYVAELMEDGMLDDTDRWRLEELRKKLGLHSDEALQLLHGMLQKAKSATLAKCPHCGNSLQAEPGA